MSMTPPGSNTGTPQRPAQEEDDMSVSSSARRFEKQKQDDLMASSDDDEVKVKAGTAEDEMLSPASSDIETDTEKDTKEKGEVRDVSRRSEDEWTERGNQADAIARGNTFQEE